MSVVYVLDDLPAERGVYSGYYRQHVFRCLLPRLSRDAGKHEIIHVKFLRMFLLVPEGVGEDAGYLGGSEVQNLLVGEMLLAEGFMLYGGKVPELLLA